MANKTANVAGNASQNTTKDTKQTKATTTTSAVKQVVPTNMVNLVNSYNADTPLRDDDVVLLRAEQTNNEEKIRLVYFENIPRHRKDETAEKTVEIDMTLVGNMSDDRFSMSYTWCWSGNQIVDAKKILGTLVDKHTKSIVDLADSDAYEMDENGVNSLQLNILNPRYAHNKFRLRIKEVQRTQMRVKVIDGVKTCWEKDNLFAEWDDGSLKSSAMQRGRGGDIIRHSGKPMFSDKKIVAVPTNAFPKHIILEQDEQVIDDLDSNEFGVVDNSEVVLGSETPETQGIPQEFMS